MIDYSREFIILTSHMSFTSAAKKLNISQPGLSRHIAELEKYLGFKLINRNPVALTPAGRYYLEQVSPLIENWQRIMTTGREIARSAHDTIRILKPPMEGQAAMILNEAIFRAHELRPFLEFDLKKDRKYSVIDALSNNVADIGFVFRFTCKHPTAVRCSDVNNEGCVNPTCSGDIIFPDGLAGKPLFTDYGYVLMRKDNPFAEQEGFTLKDIAHCYLSFSTNRRFADWNDAAREIYRLEGVEPRIRMKDYDDIYSFFATFQSDEVSLIDSVMAAVMRVNPRFVVREPVLSHAAKYYTMVLVYRQAGPPPPPPTSNPNIKFFADLCLDVARDIIPDSPV